VLNQRAAFGRPSDVLGGLTAGLALGERVAVPPEGDKSPHVRQELWGFGGVVAAAGLSTFSSHRLRLRHALRAKLTPPCRFGSATRIFFLRSAITYRSRG
jgi:hypothetical protein